MRMLYLFVLSAAISGTVLANNVDLVTLPRRHQVQLTIYNSEDLTFVKERRYVTLKKGVNALQYSWAGTLIDPTSVEFRPLEHGDEIEILDTIFPGRKPQHLVWHIRSEYEGQAEVQVSYFTSGLTWSMDYVGVTDRAEERMDFSGYVSVVNHSGEDYEDAEVRLIVGSINLVEKIADLAQRQGIPTPMPEEEAYSQLRAKAAKESFDKAAMAMEMAAGVPLSAPKGIVKEGVSEYFMFTIEGTETIKDGWSKRMRAVNAKGLDFDIVFRMRKHQYGERPARFFIWKNNKEHELGTSPLPNGLIRVFRENGDRGLSYLGEQTVHYVPVKDMIEINLGSDDLVVYEAKKLSTKRLNFHFNKHGKVSGWDEEQEWKEIIKNHREEPIVFETRKVIAGDVEYDSEIEAGLFDYHTVEMKFTVPARDEKENTYTLVFHRGGNKKKDMVKID